MRRITFALLLALASCTKLDPLSPIPAADTTPSIPWPGPLVGAR